MSDPIAIAKIATINVLTGVRLCEPRFPVALPVVTKNRDTATLFTAPRIPAVIAMPPTITGAQLLLTSPPTPYRDCHDFEHPARNTRESRFSTAAYGGPLRTYASGRLAFRVYLVNGVSGGFH